MAIADKKEILEFFTETMRNTDGDISFANVFKAAENLGKYYGLFKGANENEGGDVIIVDDIRTDKHNSSQ